LYTAISFFVDGIRNARKTVATIIRDGGHFTAIRCRAKKTSYFTCISRSNDKCNFISGHFTAFAFVRRVMYTRSRFNTFAVILRSYLIAANGGRRNVVDGRFARFARSIVTGRVYLSYKTTAYKYKTPVRPTGKTFEYRTKETRQTTRVSFYSGRTTTVGGPRYYRLLSNISAVAAGRTKMCRRERRG